MFISSKPLCFCDFSISPGPFSVHSGGRLSENVLQISFTYRLLTKLWYVRVRPFCADTMSVTKQGYTYIFIFSQFCGSRSLGWMPSLVANVSPTGKTPFCAADDIRCTLKPLSWQEDGVCVEEGLRVTAAEVFASVLTRDICHLTRRREHRIILYPRKQNVLVTLETSPHGWGLLDRRAATNDCSHSWLIDYWNNEVTNWLSPLLSHHRLDKHECLIYKMSCYEACGWLGFCRYTR